MTRDDIIKMARQMGGFYDRHPACINDHFVFPTEESLERFANLVAAAEREACAKVCEQAGVEGYGTLAAAAMIRGRGER